MKIKLLSQLKLVSFPKYIGIILAMSGLLATVLIPSVSPAKAGEEDSCSFSPQIGRTIIQFNEHFGEIVGNQDEEQATAGPIQTNLSAGTYDIRVKAYDCHSCHPDQTYQTQESFYLILKDNNGNTVAETQATSDLPDNTNSLVELVANDLNVSKTVSSVVAFHAAYPDSPSANSIMPVCAAFDKTDIAPNLSISKSVDKSQAVPEDKITYTINYENTGDDVAHNIIIRDPFNNQNQDYLKFVDATPSPWGNSNDTWEISSLNPGGSGTITITAEINDYIPEGTTIIKNRASIKSDEISKFYSNTVSTAVYREPEIYDPDLSISKLAKNLTRGDSGWQDTVSAQPGDEIQFSIKINSTGQTVADNVYLRDNLPYQLEYISNSTSGATTNNVSEGWYNIGNIQPGDSKTVYLKAKVVGEQYLYVGSTTVTNRAETYADDVWILNDTAQVIVDKNQEPEVNNPNLSISKLAKNLTRGDSGWQDTVSAQPGDEIQFSIKINSTGDSTAENVYVRDYLPYKMEYVHNSVSGATTHDITGGWYNIGDIPAGSSKTVYLKAEVKGENHFYPGSTMLNNRAETYADDVWILTDDAEIIVDKDEEPEDNPGLSISKLAKNLTQGDSSWQETVYAQPGDEIRFYIRIHSNGNTDAENVRVRDYLPSQLEYINGSTSGAITHDITGGWYNIGDIQSGSSRTIYLEARVEGEEYFSEGYTSLTNRAEVYGDDISTIEDTAKISVYKQGTPDNPIKELMISKLVRNLSQEQSGYRESVSILAGDQLEFSIKITNIGNEDLSDITVWDNLNNDLTYIDGSSTIEGVELGDGITGAGILVSDLNISESKIIKFRVIVNDSVDNLPSGTTELVNYAYARSVDIPTISDTAVMTVTKGEVLGASTVQTGPAESLIWSIIISLFATIVIFFVFKKQQEINGIYNGLRLKFALAKAKITEQ